ncbi:unnamed protein product [Linum tenue]|uniref:beta-carotene 3-hydroxylase n=1 Tax=Linum tenue TaxID=586396 RepID=A0AAV0K1C0_9ROSI|nr:unnamed protein product [Linum tenue]
MASSSSSSSWVSATFPVPMKHRNQRSGRINSQGWVRAPINRCSWNRGKQSNSSSRLRGLSAEAAINETSSNITSKRSSSSSSSSSKEGRLARKETERLAYLVAAMLSSVGITSMAAIAVFSRFSWQLEGGEFPVVEMFGTFALSVGAAVGMEFWARWAHRALWHDSWWHIHESHHRARREGAFEANDVFAITNAVPAIALLSYGFFNKGIFPGLCFGTGLGITVFGMAYMFVHDGLVHRRFPVGPIANVHYLQTVAAAHQVTSPCGQIRWRSLWVVLRASGSS